MERPDATTCTIKKMKLSRSRELICAKKKYKNTGAPEGRINRDVLHDKRAEYGKAIVSTLSAHLMELYGKDFNSRNLYRMMQFAWDDGRFHKDGTRNDGITMSYEVLNPFGEVNWIL